MSNLIQIKRSLTTATPTSLANGELAYTANGDQLFIGSNGAVVPIGGKRTPGTLTANQALVANSTSGIDKIITANAVITTLWANGSGGSNGQVLVTNGSAVFWGTGTSGANTQVQFNDSGVANATAGFTFDKTSNTLFVGNNVYTTTVNAASHTTGGGYGTVTGGAIVNSSVVAVGNSSSNVILSYANISIGSMYANGSYLSLPGTIVAYTANLTTAVNIGSPLTGSGGVIANNTTVIVGNNTINTFINSSGLNVNGSAVVANSSGVFTTGTVNAATVSVGSNFSANSTKVTFAGANIDATSATAALQNLNVSQNITVTGNASVNGSLTVNGAVTFGDISSSDTINPIARFANNIIPSANLAYSLGDSSHLWDQIYANNLHINTASYSGDVSIGGSLTVSGNVITTNVQSVIVSDPLIYLAGNNYSSDLVDIGFVGNYYDGANNRHTGLFRHAADDTYYLFKGLTQELDDVTVVDVNDPSFRLATLKAYIISGGFTTNSTSAHLTANSTFHVGITANTANIGSLSLTSPLAGIYGGTGLTSYNNNDIIVANSTNGFNKLSLGASGYVLQSNGTALVYDILDGGSF
jgi:hypothetical protein